MGEFTDTRLTKKDKEGQYNMCKAVEEIKVKSKSEGKIEEASKRANMEVKDFEIIVHSKNIN